MNEDGTGTSTEILTEIASDRDTRERAADADVLTDEDTAELPVLDLATSHAAVEPAQEPSGRRAASWVRDVEAELERLQQRWETVDKSLAGAHERATSLQATIERKDATIAQLRAELDSRQRRIDALEASIAERDTGLSSLERASRDRDEQLAAAAQSLAETRTRAGLLESRLQAATQELETLQGSLHDEKTRATELRAERQAAASANASLRAKLHDLEAYIDGRRDKWVEQQAALKSHETAIASLETELADAGQRLVERDAAIDALETRIRELEREAGELVGRHKERESAHRQTRRLLDERIAEIERLRAQLEHENAGAGKAIEEASLRHRELDALRAEVADKDASIRHLEAELGKVTAVMSHLEDEKRSDRKTIHELQQALAELGVQRDASAASLDGARAEQRTLERKLADAERASAQLHATSAAQAQRIAALEAELDARAEIIAGFEANAERLNRLSRNLSALQSGPLDLERVPEITDERHPEDLLEAEVLFDDSDTDDHTETRVEDDSLVTALVGSAVKRRRRRILMSLTDGNGDGPVYPLLKPITTIGRSKSCDIRIRDVVISRVHARLRLDADRLIVEDAGSKNGLAVNFKPIVGAVSLKPGDVICLGMHEFRYVELEQPTHTH